jgi:hypothetical protein
MKKIFSSVSAFLFLANVPGAFAAPAMPAPTSAPAPSGNPVPQEASENLGSYEVTGEAKDKITVDKMTPEIKIKFEDIVDSITDKTEKLLGQPQPVPTAEDFAAFNKLNSEQTARPWLIDFSKPPLITFLPAPSKVSVASWRLEVTDEKGNIVQTLKGQGNPVREIVWDGRDAKGKMIRVGSVYSFRFVTMDEFKNPHTTIGKAFNLMNLQYEEGKYVVMELPNSSFFKGDKMRPEIMPTFDRVADVLREYSKYPFTVEFHVPDPKAESVRARQRVLSEKIAKALLVDKDDIKYFYLPDLARGDVVRFLIKVRK